jgi:hypothetical protein
MHLIDTNRGTYRVFPVTERFQAKEIGKPKREFGLNYNSRKDKSLGKFHRTRARRVR